MTTDNFLKSIDFMRLGQAVNQEKWQPAMMILKRMSTNATELELSDIAKKISQTKICVQSKNKTQTLNAIAQLTALRVKYLKEMQ